ncbi:MAG: DUF4249 family protein [Bacteroidota bacterium]
MKKIVPLLLFLLPLTGCVKKTDWPVFGNDPSLIIVDAVLTDEKDIQTIRLTHTTTNLNGIPAPITGADVHISNEDSTWHFTESPANSGRYKTNNAFLAQTGKNYTLFISVQNKIYTAKANMLEGATFKELQYVKNTGNSLYHVDWVANAYSAEKAAQWELLFDWSMVPGYQQADSASTHARMLFYTLPTLDVSEIFAPEMEQISFPVGTNITERRYSLTPQHAEFVRELMLETQWAGGYFNVASANVTTNLSSGAKGFFGLCAVTSLSVTVTP